MPRTAQVSLPVHPLQLYFLLAALLIFGILLWQQRRGVPYPGSPQLLFYALFFGSTALLEPLRQNSLTLNNWLAPAAAVVAAGLLLGRALVRQDATLPAQKASR
ncbi:MAG: prolipoprotein diacylglyceryl transferase family protein [Candidatus Binatia bacterium]